MGVAHSTDDEGECERMEAIIQEREESPVPFRFSVICIPVRLCLSSLATFNFIVSPSCDQATSLCYSTSVSLGFFTGLSVFWSDSDRRFRVRFSVTTYFWCVEFAVVSVSLVASI